ncbi:hypothetical protein Cadr_000009940 [Camelus dromedarius]|uniref:Uncharacterized protein n=1 Tax=Camelus dromedarius TaxID=9838 RepID=A0A5N4DXB5_CAMDR|nr:hypothetical protein Cadr_000009940 [Camelus dromedarius]
MILLNLPESSRGFGLPPIIVFALNFPDFRFVLSEGGRFSHPEDAVDMGVHGYLTLRTTMMCSGVPSRLLPLASLSHLTLICLDAKSIHVYLSSEGLYLALEMVKLHMIRLAETPVTVSITREISVTSKQKILSTFRFHQRRRIRLSGGDACV